MHFPSVFCTFRLLGPSGPSKSPIHLEISKFVKCKFVEGVKKAGLLGPRGPRLLPLLMPWMKRRRIESLLTVQSSNNLVLKL